MTPTRYSYTFNHSHTPPLPPLPAHQHPGALPQRHLPGTVTPLTHTHATPTTTPSPSASRCTSSTTPTRYSYTFNHITHATCTPVIAFPLRCTSSMTPTRYSYTFNHSHTPPLPPLPAHQHSRCTSSTTPTRYSYTFNHSHTPPLPPLPAHQHPGALPQRHLPGTVTPLTTHTRHPYHHSQPISIPVHFLNDTYQVQLHL